MYYKSENYSKELFTCFKLQTKYRHKQECLLMDGATDLCQKTQCKENLN